MPKYKEKDEVEEKIEKELGSEMVADLSKTDKESMETREAVEKNVQAQYSLSYDHQQNKREVNKVRLKLYNNQMRKPDVVGDTTMFTVHQTIMASLYIDRLQSQFIGNEDGDDEVAENLTSLAEYDNEGMAKDQTDFDWDWDTCFFGRGLLNQTEFVRDPDLNIFLPVPEVWDPTTFLRDPRAVSVNGNTWTGKNSARFYGREITMTKAAMMANPNFFKDVNWSDVKWGGDTRSLVDGGAQARAEAQGLMFNKNKSEKDLGDVAEYHLLEWYTQRLIGSEMHKCRIWLANNRKKMVGYQDLGPAKYAWKLNDRPLYPTSHDWDGTSIPDLTEDKQRHRAIAQNLGLKAMTADLYPNYVYDQNKIKNRNDLNFGFNKFIGVDGPANESIAPLRKASPNLALLDFIYNTLDISAQKATATPEIQQGQQSSEKRTLGELNIISSKVDTRYSLSAKIFGWSEKRYWQNWYLLYKENFAEDIDQKVLRIVGALGPKFRKLTKDNIIARIDPDVKIESTTVSRAKQLEDRQTLTAYFGLALQDPSANKRWSLKKLGKVNGLQRDELDLLFPPTIDEMQAEDENVFLNKDKPVQVLAEQDHIAHMEVHNKTNATKASKAHIETHKHMMMIQKMQMLKQQQMQEKAGAAAPGPAGMPPQPGSGVPNIMPKGVMPSNTSGSTAPMA